MEAKVMIMATCKNGHQTEMFPASCIEIKSPDPHDGSHWIVWECARCPKDDYQCEVEL
jgi:hypothetical protein